jgi:hypothetical protein
MLLPHAPAAGPWTDRSWGVCPPDLRVANVYLPKLPEEEPAPDLTTTTDVRGSAARGFRQTEPRTSAQEIEIPRARTEIYPVGISCNVSTTFPSFGLTRSPDPGAAMHILPDLLITGVRFNEPPNGVALASHGASYNRDLCKLSSSRAKLRRYVTGYGPFLALPRRLRGRCGEATRPRPHIVSRRPEHRSRLRATGPQPTPRTGREPRAGDRRLWETGRQVTLFQ